MAKRILNKNSRNGKNFFKSNGGSLIMRDTVSARERLKTPFKYRWLKFKIKFLGGSFK